jgi:hypothetical protein
MAVPAHEEALGDPVGDGLAEVPGSRLIMEPEPQSPGWATPADRWSEGQSKQERL